MGVCRRGGCRAWSYTCRCVCHGHPSSEQSLIVMLSESFRLTLPTIYLRRPFIELPSILCIYPSKIVNIRFTGFLPLVVTLHVTLVECRGDMIGVNGGVV